MKSRSRSPLNSAAPQPPPLWRRCARTGRKGWVAGRSSGGRADAISQLAGRKRFPPGASRIRFASRMPDSSSRKRPASRGSCGKRPSGALAVNRFGPCFLVASQERGAAGLCRLTLFATTPGEGDPIPLASENVLVTDAPTAFAPGRFAATDITRVGAFELRLNDRVLGTASLSPVPPATLNAEGGFKPPPNFTWTTAAEEELLDRLGRLGREWGK